IAASPIGTVTRNTRRQLSSTRRPPTGGPAAAARPPTAAQMPIACERCLGSNSGSSSASEVGSSRAAPAAWITRAPTSVSTERAAPQSAEPSTKMPSPHRNSRLRPWRSASRPPETISAAITIAYAFRTQEMEETLEPANSPSISGNAMFTMKRSRLTMKTPAETSARTFQRRSIRFPRSVAFCNQFAHRRRSGSKMQLDSLGSSHALPTVQRAELLHRQRAGRRRRALVPARHAGDPVRTQPLFGDQAQPGRRAEHPQRSPPATGGARPARAAPGGRRRRVSRVRGDAQGQGGQSRPVGAAALGVRLRRAGGRPAAHPGARSLRPRRVPAAALQLLRRADRPGRGAVPYRPGRDPEADRGRHLAPDGRHAYSVKTYMTNGSG